MTPLQAVGAEHVTGHNRHIALPDSPILDDLHTTWDPAKFNTTREPIIVGHVTSMLPDAPESALHVSTLPIKFPGTDYRLPAPLQWLAPMVQIVADTELQINAHVDDFYAYLQLELTYVEAGKCQRAPGAHSDSVHGPSSKPDDPARHMYIAVSSDPTAYFVQPFDLRETPPSTHFLNPVFDRLADWDKAQFFDPNAVVLIDAYCVHSSIKSQVSGWRCFAGISFATRQFDRIGNSHNPCFDYDWPLRAYPLPAGLIGAPPRPSVM